MNDIVNDIRVFSSEEFGQIRTVEIDGEPWLVGKDVAVALGYQNASKALADHVDDEDKLNNESLSSLGQRGGWIINESGLYSLVLSSKLPAAKKFKKWVTSEVIPSIRKHGGYLTDEKIEEVLSDPDTIIKLATKLKEERAKRKALERTVTEQKPLVEFANHVGQTADTVDMGQMAKLAKAEGIDIGRNRLINWMKDKSFLMPNGNPYQRFVDAGFMKLVDVPKKTCYGVMNFTKAVFTGKGQIWIIEKLRKEYLTEKENKG